jgi:hypothetical protein
LRQYRGGVRAWRIWHTWNGNLYAIVHDKIWTPGENEAENYGEGGGFYGFSNLQEAEKQERDCWTVFQEGRELGLRFNLPPARFSPLPGVLGTGVAVKVVIGSFVAYGKTQVGTKGLRSQYAVPEYILTPKNMNYAIELLTVAEKYGMKIITRDKAEEIQEAQKKAGKALFPYVRPQS